MKEQLAVQKLLRRKLAEFQAKNSSFSVRALAQRIGIQPSAANEILKGQRRISRKMAERIAAKLHLDPSERAEILGLFPVRARSAKRLPETQSTASESEGLRDVLRLTSDQFSVISDWIHFAILNLTKTVDAQVDPAWMAERLGVTKAKIEGALTRLLRLGLIEKTASGQWKRTFARVNTTDDVLSVSIQKSHLTDMDLARESLLRDPIDLRDFSSLTLAVSPASIPRAKEILRRAQDEIAALVDDTPASEVYRLTSYLFPLTRRVPSKPETKKQGALK